MAGVAFDGSPWVTGLQASGVGENVPVVSLRTAVACMPQNERMAVVEPTHSSGGSAQFAAVAVFATLGFTIVGATLAARAVSKVSGVGSF